MPTELVPELATLTDSTLILVEVDMETGAMAGLKSADGILAGVKSVDGIFDRMGMADFVQAGVESADLAYIVPKYAPEPEPP
jgi:hypothetical protein